MIGADDYLPAVAYPLYPQLQRYARELYGSHANAKDAVLGFVNDVADLVRARGRTARITNDDLDGGSAVTLHPRLLVGHAPRYHPRRLT